MHQSLVKFIHALQNLGCTCPDNHILRLPMHRQIDTIKTRRQPFDRMHVEKETYIELLTTNVSFSIFQFHADEDFLSLNDTV